MVNVSCRFTDSGMQKVMSIVLDEPFETEDVYFEVLASAISVDVLYEQDKETHYNVDINDRNDYTVSHTFNASGESYTISIPVI